LGSEAGCSGSFQGMVIPLGVMVIFKKEGKEIVNCCRDYARGKGDDWRAFDVAAGSVRSDLTRRLS
jgi:hypothetical protein